MLSALDARALRDRPADSVLESEVAKLFRRNRLPAAAYQYPVHLEGRFIARVDFAYPASRLAVEFDGHDSHRTPAQLQRDLTRQNLLVAAGWTVLRFTWADVVERPEAGRRDDPGPARQTPRCLITVPGDTYAGIPAIWFPGRGEGACMVGVTVNRVL